MGKELNSKDGLPSASVAAAGESLAATNPVAAFWPPRDLPGFSSIPATSGSALRRDPRNALLNGLSYAIRAGGRDSGHGFSIRIDAWVYGVQSDSMSMPVMEFRVCPSAAGAAGADSPPKPAPGRLAVEELKILARAMPDYPYLGARAMSVALFFINQINAGQVPDHERILKLHGLYPGGDRDAAFTALDKGVAGGMNYSGTKGGTE